MSEPKSPKPEKSKSESESSPTESHDHPGKPARPLGEVFHHATGLAHEAADVAHEVLGLATHSLSRSLHMFGLGGKRRKPGSSPGLAHEDLQAMEAAEPTTVTCTDISPEWVRTREIDDFDAFIADRRPEGTAVRWVNVCGLHNAKMIDTLAQKYGLHPLAVEDMFAPQRPKVEGYEGAGEYHAKLFLVTPMFQIHEGRVISEQVCMFLGENTVLTFQERAGDVWDPIRSRMQRDASRMRRSGADYLFYALLDAIVDHCFPILDHYSVKLEALEERVLRGDSKRMVERIYEVKRELLLFGRQIRPLREMLSMLIRDFEEDFTETTLTYLRDVYDHMVQVIEQLETFRELTNGLADTHMTVMGNRMNEVMKVLTIFASIFIPITFIAGVYGMNFDHLPELHLKYGYYVFWGVVSSVGVGMLCWFKYLKWI